uniref:E4 protein n=1 Tax=Human papillomavirus TaxID=10566 RepID=A0A3R5W7M8_9PAPI|nr:MAG: E4 protein [Human papillomavirus]
MNNCPFQPTARLGVLRVTSPSYPPPSSTSNRPPPGIPRPHRPTNEERNKLRRKALGLPHGNQDDDDEEEKENKPRSKEEDETEEEEEHIKKEETAVHQLLTKLEAAIDQLTEQVYRDLTDFKKRLGILS